MKNRLALIVAVALGLIAVWGVNKYLGETRKQIQETTKIVRVVAAANRIKAGEDIRPNMLYAERDETGQLQQGKRLPETAVTADHILARDAASVIGQKINRNVERGDPLLVSYFRQPVERLQDKLRFDLNERALSIRVDIISGVAGNLVPGSHVDILGTFPIAKQGKTAAAAGAPAESETMVLLRNVRILAVDNRTREVEYISTGGVQQRSTYSAVTVAVTPEEASILVYAQQYGTITMTLRSPAEPLIGPVPAPVDNLNLRERALAAERAREARMRNQPILDVEPRRME